MAWIILALIGFVAGSIANLLGIGGGIILVPALIHIVPHILHGQSITAQGAVGTSLVLIIIGALSGTINNIKNKQIDYGAASIFFIGAIPGSIVGTYLNSVISDEKFNMYFGIVMFIIFFLSFSKGKAKPVGIDWSIKKEIFDDEGKSIEYGYSIWLTILISILAGIISSLFGIGGGSLMVPIMYLLYNFPIRIATATSTLVILLSSTVSSLTRLLYYDFDWRLILTITPGVWFGGRFGVFLSKRLEPEVTEKILLFALLIIALRMVIG